jgi:hypothetical protein
VVSVEETGPADQGDVARFVRPLPVALLLCGFLVDYFTPVQYTGTAFYSSRR